uniref:Uncharacterized protein n=1 Tax=Haptolina ericina TaxID=156174 RepID=A0A7S3AU80_9EUKA|mmetsp:Transcript_32280/g.72822  ORF Transcript_32280/g.72822 Transcript_32280/m.72822 type:complete len:275 (+) Transcript_32280:65-889(+)
MGMPLWLRRRCRSTTAYWEPCVAFEAIVSITSGVLVWMGFWDALEMVIPPDAYWRGIMIIIGMIGLFASRTMYDKSLIHALRQHGDCSERAHAKMLSGMEMASGVPSASSSSNASMDRSNNASAGGMDGGVAGAGVSSDAAKEAVSGTHMSVDGSGSSGALQKRPYFNPPRPDARRCGRAVFAILVGLTLWVGLWDLFDYHLIPFLFKREDGSGISSDICSDAVESPGPWQVVRSPACLGVKMMLMVIGVIGMWATRSLYGTVQVHTAQFSHFQ